MAGNNELQISIILQALDYATKDIEHVNAKVKELGAALTASEYTLAADTMDRFGDAVARTTAPMATATAQSLAFSAAITAVTSALAGKVYQSAVDYESALADLAKVTEGGAAEAAQYGKQLDQLALSYAANGQELLQAMAGFKQAGFDTRDSFALVEESLKLMIAGDIDASAATRDLVSILKGFGSEASEAGHAVDLLNAVSNQYATDVSQLASGLADLSPIARQMGFSMDESAGLLTPVIEVFQSGTEAADALKTGLQKLTDDAKPVQDALAKLGVSQRDANGALRTGREIFLDVAAAMQGLDDAQRQVLTSQLVGIDQAGRMSVVFGSLGKYLGVTTTATQSTGSAAAEVAVRLATAESAARKTEESFRQLSVTLGNAVKPELTGVVASTGALAAAFDQAVQAGDLTPLLSALRPQIQAIEKLFAAMAAHLGEALRGLDWSPLVKGLQDISGEFGAAFAALFDGIDPTTVEGLRGLLQGLVNLLGKFSEYIAGVISGLEPFLDSLNLLFSAISTNSAGLSRLIGEIQGLMTSANLVIPVVSKLASTVFGAVGAVAEFAFKVTLAVTALRLLQGAGLPIGALFSSLGGAIRGFLPTILSAIGRFTGLTTVLQTLAGVITFSAFKRLGEEIREASEHAEAWYNPLRAVRTELEIFDAVLRKLSSAYDGQVTAEEHLQEVQEATAAKFREISQATGLAIDSVEALNKAQADGLIQFDALSGKWAKVTAAAADYSAENARLLDQSNQQLAISDAVRASFERQGLTYDATTGKIDKTAASLKTLQAELATARDRYEALIQAGDAQGAAEMQQQIQALESRISSLGQTAGASAEEVAKAFERMGLKTRAELDSAAAAARKDFEIIKASGQATPQAIQAAFAQYAQAAVAANGGVADAALKAKAAQLGLQVAVSETGDVTVEKAGQAVAAYGAVNSKLEQQIELQRALKTALSEQLESLQGLAVNLSTGADTAASALTQYQQGVGIATKAQAAMNAALAAGDSAAYSYAKSVRESAESQAFLAANTAGAGNAAVGMLRMLNAEIDSVRSISGEAGDAVESIFNQVETWRGKIGDLNQLDASAFVDVSSVQSAESEIQALEAAADEAEAAAQRLKRSFDRSFIGMGAFYDGMGQIEAFKAELLEAEAAAKRNALAIEEMGAALDDLSDTYDRGEIGLADYITRLEALRSSYSRLADEDIQAVEDAIADAKAEMESFTETAESGLLTLQKEWAELNDNQAESDRLQYAQDRLEIEADLAQAQKDGNSEAISALRQQLTLLDQIYAKKQDNLAATEAETAAQASAAKASTASAESTPSGTSTTQAATQTVQTVRTVAIKISAPSGQTGTINVLEGQESTLEALLRSLESGRAAAA